MTTTPQNLIAANFTFQSGTIEAAKEFARSKPYRGTIEERRAKLLAFHQQLCELHRVKVGLTFIGDNSQHQHSGSSCYIPASETMNATIAMVGRLSVVSYLTLFGAGIGNGNMNKAKRWAFNLFQRAFPNSFARLSFNRSGLAESTPRE
jgi:hypothetical protein